MNRRQFLKISSATMALNLLPLTHSRGQIIKSTVWEIQGSENETIKALFSDLGGLANLISKDVSQATVLIKPNICLPHSSEMGTTSSPAILSALCEYLTMSGVKRIIVADHTLKKAEDFNNVDLINILEKYSRAKLTLANQQRLFQPTEINGKVLKSTEKLKMLDRVDLFINLATAKHHSATNVSLAIKNLMGLIWDRAEFHTRLDLHQAIADLAVAIRPGLNIVDASRILLKGGPTGPGPIMKDNRIFASRDIVALDSVVASRYNFGGKIITPNEVAHLAASFNNGLGEIDLEKITIKKIEV